MQNNFTSTTAKLNSFGQMTWASCYNIRNQAMRQEFSWSGLVLSLFIAFFVVAGSSYSVSLFIPKQQIIQAAVETQNIYSIVVDRPASYS